MKPLVLVAACVVAGCGSPSTSLSTATTACLVARSCGIEAAQEPLTTCVSIYSSVSSLDSAAIFKMTPASVDCLARAGSDCIAANKCLTNGVAISCTHAGETCNGDVYQYCAPTGSFARAFDCASAGYHCLTTNGGVDCGLAPCAATDSFAFLCTSDNRMSFCQHGVVSQQFDCGALGETCDASATVPHCRTSVSCTGTATRCDGNVIVACDGGHETRGDCNSDGNGFGCYANPAGGFMCARAGECDPSSPMTCSGTVLALCVDGARVSYDCAAHGYHACDVTAGCK